MLYAWIFETHGVLFIECMVLIMTGDYICENQNILYSNALLRSWESRTVVFVSPCWFS